MVENRIAYCNFITGLHSQKRFISFNSKILAVIDEFNGIVLIEFIA